MSEQLNFMPRFISLNLEHKKVFINIKHIISIEAQADDIYVIYTTMTNSNGSICYEIKKSINAESFNKITNLINSFNLLNNPSDNLSNNLDQHNQYILTNW